MKWEAIIFDLDGTLVHSVPLYEEAFTYMIRAAGAQLSPERFRELYACNAHLAAILQELDITDSADQLRTIRDAYYCDLLRKNIEWFPDAENFLATIPSAQLRGIVTGSWRHFVDAIEERIPLAPYFQTVITADDFAPQYKPDPAGLLLAAQRLGVQPAQCIYIGDQSFDVGAANAAGMTSCLIKRDRTGAGAENDADIVVTSLEALSQHCA